MSECKCTAVGLFGLSCFITHGTLWFTSSTWRIICFDGTLKNTSVMLKRVVVQEGSGHMWPLDTCGPLTRGLQAVDFMASRVQSSFCQGELLTEDVCHPGSKRWGWGP